nr:hypothetical protein [Catelliglobosispora koreensis]
MTTITAAAALMRSRMTWCHRSPEMIFAVEPDVNTFRRKVFGQSDHVFAVSAVPVADENVAIAV